MKSSKLTVLILAVASCAIVAGAAELKAAAAGNVSAGNLDAAGGRVVFHESDITYLKNEINLLQSETDYSILNMGSSDHVLNASAGSRRNLLHSRGTINYADGRVVIGSTDLWNLADGIDKLEKDYREMTTAALNSIGTYFDADGNAGHVAADGTDYVPSSCEQLMAGLLRSQSVDHLTAAPVTSDNITAGAAAWVNGQCIIGNGADNARAYQRGREDGQAGNGDDVGIQYTCHEHVTDDGQSGWKDNHVFSGRVSPGGCFTSGRHKHVDTCPISEVNMVLISYHDYTDGCDWHHWADEVKCQHRCTGCGEMHLHEAKKSEFNGSIPGMIPCDVIDQHKHYACKDLPVNTWAVGCGRKAGQVESATIHISSGKE
ncbi:MAG: hypothetical protein J1F18_06095 [Lachnospiraceae bacterium]|nr:hypothetical protein [Lachnospiraceae bacterium]